MNAKMEAARDTPRAEVGQLGELGELGELGSSSAKPVIGDAPLLRPPRHASSSAGVMVGVKARRSPRPMGMWVAATLVATQEEAEAEARVAATREATEEVSLPSSAASASSVSSSMRQPRRRTSPGAPPTACPPHVSATNSEAVPTCRTASLPAKGRREPSASWGREHSTSSSAAAAHPAVQRESSLPLEMTSLQHASKNAWGMVREAGHRAKSTKAMVGDVLSRSHHGGDVPPPFHLSRSSSDIATEHPALERVPARRKVESFDVPARLYNATASASKIDGYLIDLDGTMYQPGGLLPGARDFYCWLLDSGKPYVFLSNTGAKNSLSVQAKFRSAMYLLHEMAVPLDNILTAGEAQVDFMLATVPPHARILVIQGGSGVWRDDLRTRGGAAGAALADTWDIRTALSDEEAKEWATYSACSRLVKRVWVAFFTDGEVTQPPPDTRQAEGSAHTEGSPGAEDAAVTEDAAEASFLKKAARRASLSALTDGLGTLQHTLQQRTRRSSFGGEKSFGGDATRRSGEKSFGGESCGPGPPLAEGFNDWGFEMVKAAGALLSHGAQFVYTADDAFNPSTDPKHPGMMFPLPGPGMFAAMMRTLMYPHNQEAIFCCGKGGNMGKKYMMEAAIDMLRQQGHSGERRRIVMVGDRFDTDIRAGLSVGISTCLVTSGCHNLACQQSYRKDPAHFHAPSVISLIADGGVRAEVARMAEKSGSSARSRKNSKEDAGGSPPPVEQLAEGLREWMLGQGNVLRPRSDNDDLWESLQPALMSHFEAWEDKYGNGQIDARGLSQAVQQLGLGQAELIEYAAGLEPQLRSKVQRMLLSHSSTLAAATVQHAGAGGGPAGDGGADSSTAIAKVNEIAITEVAITEVAISEGSESCALGRVSLNAEEFCEVVGGALVAAGVLARKRWKTHNVVFSFLGTLRGSSLSTGASPVVGRRSPVADDPSAREGRMARTRLTILSALGDCVALRLTHRRQHRPEQSLLPEVRRGPEPWSVSR